MSAYYFPVFNLGKDGWGKRLSPLILPGCSWVFRLFQSRKHCSILKHSEVTWSPRKCATSTCFSLGDFLTVTQAPGFQTSYGIISAKCAVWNRGRVPGATPASELPLSPVVAVGSPPGTPRLHRTQLGGNADPVRSSSVYCTTPQLARYLILFYTAEAPMITFTNKKAQSFWFQHSTLHSRYLYWIVL